MKTVAIIQARMGSSRLPGKVLMDLGHHPVIHWVVRAAGEIPGVDEVVVATSDHQADDAIANWCKSNQVLYHRGSESDVLSRFAEAATKYEAETIIRLTADCPLLDPQVCGTVLSLYRNTTTDYASNCSPANWPDGLDCEVFSIKALTEANDEAVQLLEREHVTPFIHYNRHRYRIQSVQCPLPDLQNERWTLDNPNDLTFLQSVVGKISNEAPPSYLDVLNVLDRNPAFRSINQMNDRKEGLIRALAKEPVSAGRSYTGSRELLERAVKSIPLGSQTFSKSHIQYPERAPMFLTYGDGGCVWDVDGNRYVDYVMGLLPVVLGYRDPDVDKAISDQLACGISFSLATELEVALAEKLIELIPSAEMVRFGKNGTDATSAAVRLSRAFTGRDRIIACGYHGWQDWYIGATTRNKGIPEAVGNLTHMSPYNDLQAVHDLLNSHPGEFAALIMEPMNITAPNPGYLEELKSLLHEHGCLLVFDEIITGFRFSLGGAQELYDIKPDLSCFGKSMGNGMPISAIVGRADIMMEMEEIFFSGTFGGECLSIAASLAVINKMEREPVIASLWEKGDLLAKEIETLIATNELTDVISLNGAAPWKLLSFNDHPNARKELIRSVFIQEMLSRGVLLTASHNVSYAHDHENLSTTASAYSGALEFIRSRLREDSMEDALTGPVIEPIFKVR